MVSVEFKKSPNKNKKLQAIFYNDKGKKIKSVSFGQAGASDYTINKDPKRRKLYLDRHRKRENWSDFMTAGALSRWILWEKTDLQSAIALYIKNFSLNKV
jgi:hypothetical protein